MEVGLAYLESHTNRPDSKTITCKQSMAGMHTTCTNHKNDTHMYIHVDTPECMNYITQCVYNTCTHTIRTIATTVHLVCLTDSGLFSVDRIALSRLYPRSVCRRTCSLQVSETRTIFAMICRPVHSDVSGQLLLTLLPGDIRMPSLCYWWGEVFSVTASNTLVKPVYCSDYNLSIPVRYFNTVQAHVGNVWCKQYGLLPQLILTFILLLVSPIGLAICWPRPANPAR